MGGGQFAVIKRKKPIAPATGFLFKLCVTYANEPRNCNLQAAYCQLLVGHQHGINYVYNAITLVNIGNCNFGHAAFFIRQIKFFAFLGHG